MQTADKVKKGVAEPFCYRWKGDHRGMHYDIPEMIMFGNKMENVYHTNGRGISSKDTKQVTKYLKAVHHHLQHNNIIKRMAKLMSDDQPNHKEAEAIDRELTRAGLHGESKCRKRRRDYWDLNIHVIKTKLSLWSQLKRRRKRHLFTHVLCARARSLGVEMDNTSNEEVEQIIQSLIVEMKKHFKEETERRDEFMLNQANLAAEAGEEEKANVTRNIRTCERKKEQSI